MIYCDNAATTKISDEVFNEMLPYLKDNFGNPSSLYSIGYKNKKAIEKAREQVAKAINAEPSEIFFTSGATESNNWVLNGIQSSNIITSDFEHASILNTCKKLEENHHFINYIKPNSEGIISVEDIEKEITCDTRLISIMAVNNEIGTIQPIKEIGEMCREHRIYFHTDATQAIGHIPIDVQKMNIDLMSFSGHKFHAPKGIGVLYIRNGVKIQPFMNGGHQESLMRAGTENVASIVGIGKAIEIATHNLGKQNKLREMTNTFINRCYQEIGDIKLNGSYENRIAGTVNLCVNNCYGEEIVLLLDTMGICVSAGSACNSGTTEPSRTLKAIGLTSEQALDSIRFSFDADITELEIKEVFDSFKKSVQMIDRINEVKEK